ncbi:MAG: LacI family DNA-binding transcriptional regulator [Betaproteobacteria bacterium]
MSRPPTIATVAREAGVSTATVDRVLNSRLPVKEGTAMRVIAAAERIGYHGAALMRERLRERTPLRTLGFCLQKRSDLFYQAFAREVTAAARQAGEACVAVVEFIDDIDPRVIAQRLLDVGDVCDALAVVAVDHAHVTAAIETLAAQGKPVFTLLSDLSAPSRAGYVGVDPRHAGRTAAWAISRLARPERPEAEVGVFVGSHRYLGQETCEISFRSYLREHAPQFHVLETRVNLEDERLAYEAAQELLARHPALDGLYVAGGGIPGILRALREHPRHVVTVITELMPERRQALVDGVVDLVFGTPLARISATAVTMMLRALEQVAGGGTPMVAAQFPQPFDVYTPENV